MVLFCYTSLQALLKSVKITDFVRPYYIFACDFFVISCIFLKVTWLRTTVLLEVIKRDTKWTKAFAFVYFLIIKNVITTSRTPAKKTGSWNLQFKLAVIYKHQLVKENWFVSFFPSSTAIEAMTIHKSELHENCTKEKTVLYKIYETIHQTSPLLFIKI